MENSNKKNNTLYITLVVIIIVLVALLFIYKNPQKTNQNLSNENYQDSELVGAVNSDTTDEIESNLNGIDTTDTTEQDLEDVDKELNNL